MWKCKGSKDLTRQRDGLTSPQTFIKGRYTEWQIPLQWTSIVRHHVIHLWLALSTINSHNGSINLVHWASTKLFNSESNRKIIWSKNSTFLHDDLITFSEIRHQPQFSVLGMQCAILTCVESCNVNHTKWAVGSQTSIFGHKLFISLRLESSLNVVLEYMSEFMS